MKISSQWNWVIVRVSGNEIDEFKRHFPCSGLPDHASFQFEFDKCNGDLVAITMWLNPQNLSADYAGELADSADYDGAGLLALSHDAGNAAVDAGRLPQWARKQ